MDDIFDSLIYILITLAAFAISLLGKKKKQAPRAPVNFSEEESPEKENPSFLSDFERFFEEEDKPVESEGTEPSFVGENRSSALRSESRPGENQINQEILDTVPEELQDEKEKMPYSIEHEDTSEIFSRTIEDQDITLEEEEGSPIDFDLEKAIIYSEILNQKDY
ncbi:MAG: hypothetical protein V2I54_03095 [Bacteroidales bacterium]|jgi:hypothetical protein|nr:hypothetical protein [Bacteroidales bacterium]